MKFKPLSLIGDYVVFIGRTFRRPVKHGVFFEDISKQLVTLGYGSIGIIAIISLFMGAVITIQTATNLENPFLPKYLIGLVSRDTMLLEFSSTIACLILSGKVGSNISSEIGTMQITEQIDALEVMGIPPEQHVVLPKVIAGVLLSPVFFTVSAFIGIFGGWMVGEFSGIILTSDYIYGLQYMFNPFFVTYSLVKIAIFMFIITSVSAFYGYNVRGGALDVGKSSTKAVVTSSIIILLFNLLLSYIMLL